MPAVERHSNVTFDHPSDFIFDSLWEYVRDIENPVINTFGIETETDVATLVLPDIKSEIIAAFIDRSRDWSGRLIKMVRGSKIAYVGYLWNGDKFLNVRIVSSEEGFGEAIWRDISKRLSPVTAKDDTKVQVKFWFMGGNGPSHRTRELTAPDWAEISDNYAAAAREELGRLIGYDKDTIPGGGKIVVLHGPPGTGKTTLLRALAQEWKDWCSIDYIVDPERFFGEAAYMTNVLLDGGGDEYPGIPYGIDDEEDFHKLKPRPTWRLIIVEDAEEFIKPNAKETSGQSLSRLLNIGDGLVGQGLNVVLLLTTNVKLEEMHPAIKRPGRCLAHIGVPSFNPTEAREWLGHSTPDGKGATLAELYEMKNRRQIVSEKATTHTGLYL